MRQFVLAGLPTINTLTVGFAQSLNIWCTHTHTHTHTHRHTHTYTHTYTHIHTYTTYSEFRDIVQKTRARPYKHTHIHTHACTHTHIPYIHIHTHTHTYTYKHTLPDFANILPELLTKRQQYHSLIQTTVCACVCACVCVCVCMYVCAHVLIPFSFNKSPRSIPNNQNQKWDVWTCVWVGVCAWCVNCMYVCVCVCVCLYQVLEVLNQPVRHNQSQRTPDITYTHT